MKHKKDIREGYIYILQDKNKPIEFKLGRTIEPFDRLQMYNVRYPHASFVYFYVSDLVIHSKGLEQLLRAYLWHKHKLIPCRGREWYDLKGHRLSLDELVIEVANFLSKPEFICAKEAADYRVDLSHYRGEI